MMTPHQRGFNYTILSSVDTHADFKSEEMKQMNHVEDPSVDETLILN
jgi:hypothetical protein